MNDKPATFEERKTEMEIEKHVFYQNDRKFKFQVVHYILLNEFEVYSTPHRIIRNQLI